MIAFTADKVPEINAIVDHVNVRIIVSLKMTLITNSH